MEHSYYSEYKLFTDDLMLTSIELSIQLNTFLSNILWIKINLKHHQIEIQNGISLENCPKYKEILE